MNALTYWSRVRQLQTRPPGPVGLFDRLTNPWPDRPAEPTPHVVEWAPQLDTGDDDKEHVIQVDFPEVKTGDEEHNAS